LTLDLSASIHVLAATHGFSAEQAARLHRYILAAAQFYAVRDGLSDFAARRHVERVTAHLLANIALRLPPLCLVNRCPVPGPLFYPGAYIDLLPVLFSDIEKAVLLDVAYFQQSGHAAASFPAPAALLTTLCGAISDAPVASDASKDELTAVVLLGGRRCSIRFIHADWNDGERISRALPQGAGLYYGTEMPLLERGADALPSFSRLAPSVALLRSREAARVPGYQKMESIQLPGSAISYNSWERMPQYFSISRTQ